MGKNEGENVRGREREGENEREREKNRRERKMSHLIYCFLAITISFQYCQK